MSQKNKHNNSTILRGIVLPTQWDMSGRVMRISLNTHDENEYMIDYSGPGKELLDHLRETIEIDGKVLQRMGGALYVKVNSFNVLTEQLVKD